MQHHTLKYSTMFLKSWMNLGFGKNSEGKEGENLSVGWELCVGHLQEDRRTEGQKDSHILQCLWS